MTDLKLGKSAAPQRPPDVRDVDLITLAEREIQRLTEENEHSAAVIMRELCERLRSAATATEDAKPRTVPLLGGAEVPVR